LKSKKSKKWRRGFIRISTIKIMIFGALSLMLHRTSSKPNEKDIVEKKDVGSLGFEPRSEGDFKR
jgi:hypothetical protein